MQLDDLDRALLTALVEAPRAGLREHARKLNVARGTVESRYKRLQQAGIIASVAPQLSPAGLGFPVLAFVHLHLAQGRLNAVAEHLTTIPHVIEAHTTTGDGDLLCRVAARDNTHLEELIQTLIETPGVVRTRSEIALAQRVPTRLLPLVQQTQHCGPSTENDRRSGNVWTTRG